MDGWMRDGWMSHVAESVQEFRYVDLDLDLDLDWIASEG